MLSGIVISNISNLYKVEVNNIIYDCTARGKIKSSDLVSPVSGDYVEIDIVDELKNIGVINNIKERKNYIKRPKMANLTNIILVISMKNPKPDLLLLDKQLAYAEYMNLKPIICLNKIDLEDDDVVNKIFDVYTKIGYIVLKTNAKLGYGIDNLKNYLLNNITAFSGNSGVGKSTLINHIIGNDITQEGDISKKNKRGKNTTTQVNLYKINNNSYIADTPGFSTFDIFEIDKKDLAKYFIEFRNYLDECEYLDCSHIKEENCGIKMAVENGKIAKERYDRYCQIYETLNSKKKEY